MKLNVDRHTPQAHSSSLAQWVYSAIGQSGVRLRVRLGGNNLHILCESRQSLDAKAIIDRLLEALENRETGEPFPVDPEHPIYQIIVYGRTVGQERPDWIKQIRLKASVSQNIDSSQAADSSNPELRASNENLARSGSPEAIARYLSETLSPLGVRVKVLIQTLKPKSAKNSASSTTSETLEFDGQREPSNRRLWVICNSDYSPDASVLTEPVVQQLRALRLQGFQDAAICSQVTGEASPEWMLRVDLTPAEEMLREWARWGDVQAITRLLNQSLAKAGLEVRAVLKDVTLHLFCSPLAATPTPVPDKQECVSAIASVLDHLSPQGIQAATVYGVEFSERPVSPEQEQPVWIEWLNLPAANHATLGDSVLLLAQKGHQGALTFLLERLLNPDLDRRLATGGIHLKLRRKQDLLHIMSEAPICPPQAQIAPPIARFLRQLLNAPEIAGVRIYGRRAGSNTPSWNYGVDFKPRQRLVPEATPEFAASDAYIHDLIAPPGTTVLRPDLTQQDVQNGMSRAMQSTVRALQQGLCATQLFVKSEDPESSLVPQRSGGKNFAPFSGFKVALVWGVLGLVLMAQIDWLIGQKLRNASWQAQSSAPSAPEAPSTSLSLPQISLQKSEDRAAQGFNASGFTREGNTEITVSETEQSLTPEKASAAKAAILAAARTPNPSFNNPLLDEKLVLYQQHLLQKGPPDILIIGSSRALRGVDPIALQDALAAQGYPELEVFNFAINGATAQVVDLILRRLLTPEQLPKLIIWADGARAFNSGRDDATYNAIATSEGYQTLQAGNFPGLGTGDRRVAAGVGTKNANNLETRQSLTSVDRALQQINDGLDRTLNNISSTYSQRDKLKFLLREHFAEFLKPIKISSAPTDTNSQALSPEEEGIDVDGFLPLSIRFNPATYYNNHPRVAGDYDGDYQSFRLTGQQDTALDSLLQFARANNIDMVFVNLPLTKDYLDPVRSEYEAKFQQYMRSQAKQKELIFRDLSQLLLTQPDLFSDPSHLNRYGAYKVSNHLAQDPVIPWPTNVTED
jgi:hypothetical protein